MRVRVIVNGANGKMGKLACSAIENHDNFTLVARLGRGDNLSMEITKNKADVVVDLTTADSVYENSIAIIQSGARPVIGASGLLEDQINDLSKRCEKNNIGGIIVPNFSIGAVLMMQFAAQAARLLPEVEIIEAHHQQKLDAPSGTALKTAEMIAKARVLGKNKLQLKELIPGVRGGSHVDVPIHSLRIPGVLAQQQIIFGSLGETLTITHNSIDRASFMPGVILACQSVLQLDKLYYGLEHILP